ncbi:hypothetical protein BGZ54_004419 [Gamsiella multidivaricata]|nr:hypothetical protein BGZ54_004419 [Gamsiella multidivaricata]
MMTGYHRMQRPIINAHRFNKRLNSARARIEHAFGMLKGRFPSLTNLRQVIRQEEDVDKVCNHVMACVVVHNILTMLDKDDEELMDLDAQRNLEELRQEQERPDVQVNGAVEEEIPAPGEEVDEEIDFEDWREVARYDAAMKTWGDIKRAQRKAIMFSE